MYLVYWIRCNTDISCRSIMGTPIVKNLKILVEEIVRSTAVGTSRILHARRAAKGGEVGGRRLAAKGRGVQHRQGDKLGGNTTGKRLDPVAARGGRRSRRLALAGRRLESRCVLVHELVGLGDWRLGSRCRPFQLESPFGRSI